MTLQARTQSTHPRHDEDERRPLLKLLRREGAWHALAASACRQPLLHLPQWEGACVRAHKGLRREVLGAPRAKVPEVPAAGSGKCCGRADVKLHVRTAAKGADPAGKGELATQTQPRCCASCSSSCLRVGVCPSLKTLKRVHRPNERRMTTPLENDLKPAVRLSKQG